MTQHLPSEQYQPSRGLQNTWEVSFQGQHIAKRSFLKYGGEPAAAKHVLWEAWAHHRRRTGESCPIPWLNNEFQISDTTPLSQLVPAVPARKSRKIKTPAAELAAAAEPAARKKRKATTEPSVKARRASGSNAGAKRKPKAKPARTTLEKRKKKIINVSEEASHNSGDIQATSSSSTSSSSSSSSSSCSAPDSDAEV